MYVRDPHPGFGAKVFMNCELILYFGPGKCAAAGAGRLLS
jgi:hypothetical protein